MTTRRSVALLRAFAALVIALAGAAAVPSAAAAQEEIRENGAVVRHADAHALAPTVRAVRRTGRVVIDGRIDEAAWLEADVVRDFVQTEPHDGAPSTERTEVFILFDEDALYIAARLHDSTGDVRSRLGRRDSMLGDSDWFYVMIDSHHDHLTAYQFSVNPAGVKRDETLSGGRNDTSWDAVWEVGTSVDGDGWSVEMRIPYSQVRFAGAGPQTWGIQLSRRINRLQEVSVFSHTPRSMRGGIARYGHLTGLDGLRTGKRIEVLPYVVARGARDRAAAGNPFRGDGELGGGYGLDTKYRVNGALTLDATINPDFGQVEVDPAVVNLSAFETSFSERRPFFVEGADIFRYGDTRLFYSRRIGRAPQGSLPDGVAYADRPDASTILGAVKLSGRTRSGWSVGLLQAVTAEESAAWIDGGGEYGRSAVEPLTNYTVARLMRDFRGGQSQLGFIGTGVSRRLDDDALAASLRSSAWTGGFDVMHEFLNRTWSAEGEVSFSHVLGSPAAMLRTQNQSSRYFGRPDAAHLSLDSAMTSLSGFAARLEVGKRAGVHWRGEASVSAISPGYEINDAGFQTGVDRINSNVSVTYVQNTPSPRFRNWRVSGGPQLSWNFGGDWLGGRTNVNWNGQFANFWGAYLGFSKRVVGFDDRLTRGGPLARDRAGQAVGGSVNTDSRRIVSGRVNANYSWGAGEGLERRLSFNVSMRPADFWSFSLGPSWSNNVTTAQYVTSVADSSMTATYGRRYLFAGLDQTTVSMDARLNVNFTADLSFELFAQPFLASGDYFDYKQLSAPGAFDFQVFGRDAGSVSYDPDTNHYSIDPDDGGPAAAFDLRNRDFTTRSLRGNAVMRWEYRPGSALFLVWQQRRSDSLARGDFAFRRDARGLFDASPSNIFLVKLNYWLNL